MNLEASTIRKLMWRIVPLLGIASLLQGLDQLNISFAGLQMRGDLGFSAAVFGLGSGLFFVTYTLLGMPSNILLLKFGARRWIAFILFAFGPLTAATALVWNPHSFYVVRLLLGAAEAGFVPGIIYAVGLWFPDAHRGRVLAWMLACNPIAATIGAPISGWILGMNGVGGLQGWQWVFIIEGLPVVFLAIWFLKSLPEHPARAEWLSTDERLWLQSQLTNVPTPAQPFLSAGNWNFFREPVVLGLAAIFFCVGFLPFATIFFLPQIIRDFGLPEFESAALSALPTACGVVTMLLWSKHSDLRNERVFHCIIAQVVAFLGAVLVLLAHATAWRMTGLCMIIGGVYGFLPIFWLFPSAYVPPRVAAGGIALINGTAGLAGFVAPAAMGLMRDITGSYNMGLICAGAVGLGATLFLLLFRSSSEPITQPRSG